MVKGVAGTRTAGAAAGGAEGPDTGLASDMVIYPINVNWVYTRTINRGIFESSEHGTEQETNE
jgi:hypothetical protein